MSRVWRARGAARRILAVLALALTTASCGQGTAPSQVLQVAEGRGQLVVLYPGERPAMPRLEGDAVTSDRLDTDRFRGRPLVLNVWGSWCAPCKQEQPDLQQASAELEPLGVQFLGIAVRDSRTAAQAHLRRYAVTYPSFFDRGYQLVARLPVTLRAVPSTVLVDRDGRVVAVVHGIIDRQTLVDTARRLFQ